MKKTFALAALLAATAFTPALAQEEPREGRRMAEGATAQEPTPIPQRVEAQMAQRDRGERGPRVDGGGNGGGQARPEGGWQRREPSAPTYQAPAPQAPAPQAQVAPTQQRWNRPDAGGAPNWQGQTRPDWSTRNQNGQANQNGQSGQPGWSRPATPPVVAAPAQPQGNWQNRDQNPNQRRDTWRDNGRNNNGGVVVQRQDNRGWNGNNGWNNQTRNGVQGNDGRRNDTWRNDGRNDNRNDRQWSGNGRNDTWRNDGRNNDRRYDQRSQWQNQYRDWNRNWSRDWRRDQRYDWQRYRYSNRNLFQNDRYYAPYGWSYGYRRFTVGFSLSYLLYDQQYWIDDPYSYRLPPVYGPYRWVRYYDDVLLVDLRSGQVVDAIYDFFE